MPKKHNKSKRSKKKGKRKERPPRQLETISSESSGEDNPEPGTPKDSSPQPETLKPQTSQSSTPELRSSDEGSPVLKPYEETEPRVPLIPGVGLPGRQRHDPEPETSGSSKRTPTRGRRKDKRTKSLEHTPESSPKSDTSSRSHSVGSGGSGGPETEKESVFNENMSYDDVTEVMYRRYREDGYVRSAALHRVTFETKRTLQDVTDLINARIPEDKEDKRSKGK